jgi:hypothetical protein
LKKIEGSKPDETDNSKTILADRIVYRKLVVLTLPMEVLENSSWGQEMMDSPPSSIYHSVQASGQELAGEDNISYQILRKVNTQCNMEVTI